MLKPTAVIGNAELYLADCMDVLPQIRNCDAVVADPPYGINTKSDGSGKLSPWADLTNSAHWYAAWFSMCRAALSPKGCMWTCLNWRSLVTFQKASCDARWPIESLMVWDKEWIGPGGMRGLRPSYEMVALFAMPEFSVADRSLADVQRFKASSHKPHGHPAEKPQALTDFLVAHSFGGSVLDPFMGSGTAGVSTILAGRRYIGIEVDPFFFDVACRRIEQVVKQGSLFEI